MARPNKRLKSSSAAWRTSNIQKEAIRKERAYDAQIKNRELQRTQEVDQFWAQCERHPEIGNHRGRSRTYEENCLLILAMSAFMRLWIELTNYQVWCVLDWTWTLFDRLVGQAVKMKAQNVRMLRTHFLEHGEVLVFGDGFDREEFEETGIRGAASPNYEIDYRLTKQQCAWVVQHIDIDLFKQTSSATKPWVPSAKELPIAIMEYMRESISPA